MTIRDAATIPAGVEISTDICIIGSGAAGITIARQLNGTNLNVILLEAGGFAHDLIVQRDTFAVNQFGIPWPNPEPDRGRLFGGSTNLWYGRIALPDPIDFERRPWVPYSGWPLTYHEVVPWLQVAASILDVKYFNEMGIEHWRDCPAASWLSADGQANLAMFLWAKQMYMGPRHRKLLKQSRNVQLLLNATATELRPGDSASVVAGLTVCGPATSTFTVRAAIYVLAGGGLENPRLLLASVRGSSTGFGNEYDQVGRYYMDHPRGQHLARVSLGGLSRSQIQNVLSLVERVHPRYGRAQLRITFPGDMQRQEELLNHSLHAQMISDFRDTVEYREMNIFWQRLSGTELELKTTIAEDLLACAKIPPAMVAFFARRRVGMARPTRLELIDQMEQEPDPSSRVTVDLRQRDRFFLPRLSLDWRIGESTYRSQRRMHQLVKDILSRADIRSFHSDLLDRTDERPALWDMQHLMGTTRMADSPREGVVDRDCRVHGVRNLYVAGSSVFPVGGHANPTLLIVALAARLASHLAQVSGSYPIARRSDVSPIGAT